MRVREIKRCPHSKCIETDKQRRKIAMNTNTTFNTTSEYKIGHTLYTVTTVFNPASKEHLTDILQRLIDRESEEMLGESGQ